MRALVRFLALSASLLLLAVPTAWACDELMGDMVGCSRTSAPEVASGETCHEDDSALEDCCVAHSNAGAEQSPAVASATSPLSLEVSSRVSTETFAVAKHPAATERELSGRRERARYALFSSYLI